MSGPVQPDRTGRLLAVIGGVVVLVVVVAAVAVATMGDRTASYPASSPEAAFQAYLTAYQAGDYETAYASFSAAVQRTMSFRDFSDRTGWGMGDPNARVSIERTDLTAGRATLHLAIDHYWANGLQSSSYREQRTVRLVREDGAWRIDQELVGIDIIYK